MAPLRSFKVIRRIAVSIDLDRTAARASTKSFAPYFGVVEAVAPSLCMCLKGYCSPFINTFGRAFEFVARCTSRLSLSNTVERARSAAISPNSWWKKLSVDTKLSLVGRGQADSGSFGTFLCAFYLRKSRSVSWPLFSFTSIDFWISLECVSFIFVLSLWLETMGGKNFSWEFRAHSDSKYIVLDPAARPIDCTVNSYEN